MNELSAAIRTVAAKWESSSWDELTVASERLADGIHAALTQKNSAVDPADRRKWVGILLGFARQVAGIVDDRRGKEILSNLPGGDDADQ